MKKKHKNTVTGAKGYAVLDQQSQMPHSHVSKPSQTAVKEAKDWVDYNEK